MLGWLGRGLSTNREIAERGSGLIIHEVPVTIFFLLKNDAFSNISATLALKVVNLGCLIIEMYGITSKKGPLPALDEQQLRHSRLFFSMSSSEAVTSSGCEITSVILQNKTPIKCHRTTITACCMYVTAVICAPLAVKRRYFSKLSRKPSD